jgi:hypothetical protein
MRSAYIRYLLPTTDTSPRGMPRRSVVNSAIGPGLQDLSMILFTGGDRHRWEPFRRPFRLPNFAYQIVPIWIGHADVTD